MNMNAESSGKAEFQLSTYLELTALFNTSISDIRSNGSADFTQIRNKLLEIISILKDDDRMLMAIANSPYSVIQRKTEIKSQDANIVQYGVNLAIYSLSISIEVGVPNEHLPYIAMASLCNHIGMVSADPAERNSLDITETSAFSKKALAENLSKISVSDFDHDSLIFLSGLLNDDKRITGKTSIQEEMYQYAIMISLCSSYEKLAHRKINGEFMAPTAAMKSLKNEINNYFSRNVVKIFFNKFSIYPVGTFVLLNTRETAKIVNVNQRLIMRPVVMIVTNHDGLEKIPPARINLQEKPNIYIKHSVSDDMLCEKYLTLF